MHFKQQYKPQKRPPCPLAGGRPLADNFVVRFSGQAGMLRPNFYGTLAPVFSFPPNLEPSMRASPVFAAFALACLGCASAHASLGGAPSDFPNAAARARQLGAVAPGAQSAKATSAYTISETTLDSGTVVREYSGADGRVFAVSWNGPFLPDLRTLLGQQFTALTDETSSRRQAGRGRVRVERPDLVIESGGHMRAWQGRAWIVSALPAGFSTEAIQ